MSNPRTQTDFARLLPLTWSAAELADAIVTHTDWSIPVQANRMISYNHLQQRRSYPKWGIPTEANRSHNIRVNDVDFQSSKDERLKFAALAAVRDPNRWSDFCALALKDFEADLVALVPLLQNERSATYSAAASHLDEVAASTRIREIRAQVLAQQSVSEMQTDANTYFILLDFGSDGTWLFVLIHSSEQARDMSVTQVCGPALKLAAQISNSITASTFNTLLDVHRQLKIPYAIVREDLSIVESNEFFKDVSSKTIQVHNGFVSLFDRQQGDRVRESAAMMQGDIQNRELVLRGQDSDSVVKLSVLPAAGLRLGGTKLLGLSLYGHGLTHTIDKTFLEKLFGLSQRESDIARLLATGASVREIAKLNGVSVGTIRSQLKAIFRKVGVRSQVELVAKLLRS